MWKPIEKAPKRIRSGFTRVYSFKPVGAWRHDFSLRRYYSFDRVCGNRVCDYYMDIPLIVEATTEGSKP